MSEFFKEYQRQVTSGLWIKPSADPLAHSALGLAGESGEVADIVKKSQYTNRELDANHLIEELGDVLWYATQIAGLMGVPLSFVAETNIRKLEKRHGSDTYSQHLLNMASA